MPNQGFLIIAIEPVRIDVMSIEPRFSDTNDIEGAVERRQVQRQGGKIVRDATDVVVENGDAVRGMA